MHRTASSSSLIGRIGITTGVLLAASVTSSLAAVASYSSGVLPQAGITGAADPTAQGWVASTAAPGNYNWGGDSPLGGWRITDGTSAGAFFYSTSLSSSDALALTSQDWTASWTVALGADAVSKAGGGVDDYYSGANFARQNNNAFWLETAGEFAYILIHKSDANGNVLLSDGTSDSQITTAGNQLAQEIGTGAPGNANYITFTLNSVAGTVSLTDSLGGIHGAVAEYAGFTPTQDRVVWGAFSNAGQGSTVWNDIQVSVVPEPTAVALLGLGALVCGLARRMRRIS